MRLNKIIIVTCLAMICMFINGCSGVSDYLEQRMELKTEIVLTNKKIGFNNVSKINKILYELNGSNFFNECKVFNEYNEKVLLVRYSKNEESGESDYINYWNYTDKKEVIISNAIYMFLLLDDMDKMRVILDEPIDEEFTINRSDIEEVYGIALENYNIDEENLESLITKDKVEELWFEVNS